jgi:hypothetical protein
MGCVVQLTGLSHDVNVNVNVNFILHMETMVQNFMHIFIIYFPNSLSCVTIPVQGSTKPFTRALLAVRGDR